MDDKLNKAIEFSNYRLTLNTQLEQLKSKTQSYLKYATNGGIFTIDKSLITFVKLLISEEYDEAVLLDDNDVPIQIQTQDFFDEIMSRYFEVVNEYHEGYEKIRKARNVKSILDLDI